MRVTAKVRARARVAVRVKVRVTVRVGVPHRPRVGSGYAMHDFHAL